MTSTNYKKKCNTKKSILYTPIGFDHSKVSQNFILILIYSLLVLQLRLPPILLLDALQYILQDNRRRCLGLARMLFPPVQHHGCPLGESKPADVTPVRSETSVNQGVHFLRRLISEDLAALGTGESMLLRVDVPVLHEIGLAGELHAALVALERSTVKLHVVLQALRRGELFLAQ